ncbi:UvrD-helicase domain-containing protein [Halosquirtibacter xylanolyticus]|uniref:UvrD-helicase domain-containing protein n=1 Tax=Halosquirtibacter xylanolyticus TaxID=3374599 RepID=UPI0037479073|nr:UvrD-helicase domain-containing protein [Prolixibacteraceae bacterium]
MSFFKIYKASAGSGKTYSITREYLLLILEDPQKYSNILAVTFTNKATSEMKSRILQELSIIAKGESSDHLEAICKKLDKPENYVRKVAHSILSRILKDYARFSVSTIDSFFQKVIRSFSREVQLHAAYNPELDHQQILSEAVDRLFMEVDHNLPLKQWLLEYADDRIEQGKRWNFRQELENKGGLIFQEDFKNFGPEIIDKLRDRAFLQGYITELKTVILSYEDRMKEIGSHAVKMIDDSSVALNDFKFGKSGVANTFYKITDKEEYYFELGSRALKAIDDATQWVTATKPNGVKGEIERLFSDGLNDDLKSIMALMETDAPRVYTAKLILPQLRGIGVMMDIAKHVSEISKEKNLLLLSDSSQLLLSVIEDDSSPFVFEKMGETYKHFMLDEFQDTSKLQWQNFFPLINNALSEGNFSMVVGDVKQSIYRWRNSDWQLLAKKVPYDLRHYKPEDVTLETNWRSTKNVITFNNTMFHFGSAIVQADFNEDIESRPIEELFKNDLKQRITEAYQDQFQHYSGKKENEGQVQVEFIPSEEMDSNEASLERMLLQIEHYRNQGYRYGEMAILVRKVSEGNMIANRIMDHATETHNSDMKVVSNDSLYIANALTVQFVIHALRYLIDMNTLDYTSMRGIFLRYIFPSLDAGTQNLIRTNSADGQLSLLLENPFPQKEDEIFNCKEVSSFHFFDQFFKEETLESLKFRPLYELVELVINYFHLEKVHNEWPYLQSLLDSILEYSRMESADIASFIEWWNHKGAKKTLVLSEEIDAIKIYTVHKSKGLEFKVVMIPFCNWDLYPSSMLPNTLWCQTEEAPFSSLSTIPVQYSSTMAKSLFAPYYYQEKIMGAIDNLNLLYVALTRAEEALWLGIPQPKKKSKSLKSVGDLIYLMMNSMPAMDSDDRERFIEFGEHFDIETTKFDFGTLPVISTEKESIEEKPTKGFPVASSTQLPEIHIGNYIDKIAIRKNSELFFEIDPSERSQKINYGTLVHQILEKSANHEEMQKQIRTLYFEGALTKEEMDTLTKVLKEALELNEIKPWFDGTYQVINERQIVRSGKQGNHRPDRIMIQGHDAIVVDYKTGDADIKKHQRQVEGYIDDLNSMGFKNVKGYLWYVMDHKVVEVIMKR